MNEYLKNCYKDLEVAIENADTEHVSFLMKRIVREVSYEEDIRCNKCGGTCKVESAPGQYGLIKQVVCGGYGSTALSDMTEYHFSMCEQCLSDLFKSFLLPVIEREYNFG